MNGVEQKNYKNADTSTGSVWIREKKIEIVQNIWYEIS